MRPIRWPPFSPAAVRWVALAGIAALVALGGAWNSSTRPSEADFVIGALITVNTAVDLLFAESLAIPEPADPICAMGQPLLN